MGHRLPHALPDRKTVLFTVRTRDYVWGEEQVAVQSAGDRTHTILASGSDARFAGSGCLVFLRLGTLMAAPFDLAARRISAVPVPVGDDIAQAVGQGNSFRDSSRPEIYLQPYGRPGDRVQVLPDGGQDPAWDPLGRELYYLAPSPTPGTFRMMVAAVTTSPALKVGVSRMLFTTSGIRPAHPIRAYDVVPGIGFSPDKMLQGRLFSNRDAQRYRLGVNHQHIPVHAPRCPVHSYHRDGAMRVDGNHGSTLGYEPNSYGEWQEQPDFSEPPLGIPMSEVPK